MRPPDYILDARWHHLQVQIHHQNFLFSISQRLIKLETWDLTKYSLRPRQPCSKLYFLMLLLLYAKDIRINVIVYLYFKSTANPWWKVDLGKNFDIKSVKIYTRDCCPGKKYKSIIGQHQGGGVLPQPPTLQVSRFVALVGEFGKSLYLWLVSLSIPPPSMGISL